jgi:hypothetical protein
MVVPPAMVAVVATVVEAMVVEAMVAEAMEVWGAGVVTAVTAERDTVAFALELIAGVPAVVTVAAVPTVRTALVADPMAATMARTVVRTALSFRAAVVPVVASCPIPRARCNTVA